MGLGVFHHHPRTGLACDCGYGRPKFTRPVGRLAGVNWNRLFKSQAQGKKFLALPHSQEFIDWMNRLMADDPNGWRDEIAPFLVKEYRAGRLPYSEHSQRSVPDFQVDRWGRWAAARQHPTRRGVNITGPDFTVHDINERVDEFYRDMEEREDHAAKVEQAAQSTAPVVHEFPNGYTVRNLARAAYPGEEMQLEGALMNHCIGADDQPHPNYSYIDAARDGEIPYVYSLRDSEGIPHATWHLNGDGSLAQVQGYSDHDSALRKYAPYVAHFLREHHPDVMASDADTYSAEDMRGGEYPWDAVGDRIDNPNEYDEDEYGDGEDDNHYDDMYEVRAPRTMDEAERIFEAREADERPGAELLQDMVPDEYYDAVGDGHDPSLHYESPDWESIVGEMAGEHARHQGPVEDSPALKFAEKAYAHNDYNATALNEQIEAWRAAYDGPNIARLHNDFAPWYRDKKLGEAVDQTYPDAADPSPLFHTHPDWRWVEDGGHRERVWTEDSYAYPVTDPRANVPEDQYLHPSDKSEILERGIRNRMRAQRELGATWDHLRREHGTGGYGEGRPEQNALNELRNGENAQTARMRRDWARSIQQQQETQAMHRGEDTFEPHAMDEMRNKVRQWHWEQMTRTEGLTPEQAGQRIIEYERHTRNNPEFCQVCGDKAPYHVRGCPNDPLNEAGNPGQGTLSRVAMAFPGDLYHVSPASNREAIMNEGLRAHERGAVPMFNPTGFGRGIPGNYAFEHEKDALFYAHMHARSNTPMDIWRIRNTGALPVEQDPESYMLGQGEEIPWEEAPQPHQFDTGAEMGLDADEDPPHSPTFYWHRPEPEGWSEKEDGSWHDDDASMEQVGPRQMAWRIPAHVPPEQLQHVRHVNPGDATWEEHWIGDALHGWLPDHLAPEPYHRVQWGSPQEYQRAVQDFLDHRDARRIAGTADDFSNALDKIPGARRITPVPNRAIEHNIGDRVVSEYNAPLAPDPEIPAEFHGINLNAGTIVAKHPPGTYRAYASDSDGGSDITHHEPSYHVQWDLGADWDKPQPYFAPGRVGEYLPQSRLWPEGHEALEHGLTDPKDPKSLDLLYPPSWEDADPAEGEPWS